jgi:hypothetical protein
MIAALSLRAAEASCPWVSEEPGGFLFEIVPLNTYLGDFAFSVPRRQCAAVRSWLPRRRTAAKCWMGKTRRAEDAGKLHRNGKLKEAGYSVDVALEAVEGQFEERKAGRTIHRASQRR